MVGEGRAAARGDDVFEPGDEGALEGGGRDFLQVRSERAEQGLQVSAGAAVFQLEKKSY